MELKRKFEKERGPLTAQWLRKNGYSERFIQAVLASANARSIRSPGTRSK